MTSHKNEKRYNREVMESGLKSNQYINESLANLNNYVNNYGDRLDYWTNKLNTQQLDLLSDKYLAQNAQMLRNMGQFGQTSETNRQIANNAYSQQNYLANVHNQNVMNANQLFGSELSALYNNVGLNMQNRNAGGQAAQNLDAIKNSWLGVLGSGASAVGSVMSAIPLGWTQIAGAALQGTGNVLSQAATPTTYVANQGAANSPITQNLFYDAGKQLSNKLGLQPKDTTLSISGAPDTNYWTSQTNYNNNIGTSNRSTLDTSLFK